MKINLFWGFTYLVHIFENYDNTFQTLSRLSMTLHVSNWNEQDVINFFSAQGFPTGGLVGNCVNGPALLHLYQDPNALEMFTASIASGMGLGFERLTYIHGFRRAINEILGPRALGVENSCGVKRTMDDAFEGETQGEHISKMTCMPTLSIHGDFFASKRK